VTFKLEFFVRVISFHLLSSQFVLFAMAGRPKLGSKAEIANKLSKSKKAAALQSEQAQASVLII
jgi:hypothetical protein